MSKGPLPQELHSIDTGQYEVQLEWDPQEDGLHIFVTSVNGGSLVRHWWVTGGAFFPVTLTANHAPTATLRRSSGLELDGDVLLGGADGAVRRFANDAQTDDGTAFTSYVNIGPLNIARDAVDATVNDVRCTLANRGFDSSATLSVAIGDSGEAAARASAFASSTVTEGRNYTWRPRARGGAAVFKISSTSRWALENLSVVTVKRGQRRKA